MAIPLKNVIHDKLVGVGSITDVDLYKMLTKKGVVVAQDRYNKILLDLEILGLIKVAWITKDERRIEIVIEDKQDTSKKPTEKDYEASFPGLEK